MTFFSKQEVTFGIQDYKQVASFLQRHLVLGVYYTLKSFILTSQFIFLLSNAVSD